MTSFSLNTFDSTPNQTFQPPLQTHVKNIYSCIALSTLAAGTGGFAHLYTGVGGFYNLAAGLHFMLELLNASDDGEITEIRLIYLLLFAFLFGLGWGPLLDDVIAIEPTVIPTAFFAASLIFACFTLSSVFCNHRLYVYIGCTLLYLSSHVFLRNLHNSRTGSSYLRFKTQILIGLAVMSACTIYDTEMFVAARSIGDTDYVFHSAVLFLNFLTVFQCLLVILTDKEK